MFTQMGVFLVDAVASFFVFVLLARFHFQWLRVPFRNPIGEFVLATTSFMVLPVRRVIPGLAGLDLTSVLLAWLIQSVSVWLQAQMIGNEPPIFNVALVGLVDLLRYSIYILVFAVIVHAVLSWINPYTPMAPAFDTITRPFLRPLRRFIGPLGGVDLTPLILLVILQVLLFPIGALRMAAATL